MKYDLYQQCAIRRQSKIHQLVGRASLGFVKPIGVSIVYTLKNMLRSPEARKRIREEEEMGITHGNLLRRYKRECPFRRRCRIMKEFIMTMTIIKMLKM